MSNDSGYGREIRMKEKLLKNWGIKILAVLFAFIVWFLVANIEDYTITKTITGIPVTLMNEDAITDQELVFEVTQGDTVDIWVEGRRSVVEKLTAEDFTATADLSQLSITNSVQIAVEAVNAAIRREISVSVLDSMLKVEIEERGEQKLPISVVTIGETQEGYAVVSTSATPNMVTITGAASKVKDIKTVQVEVDVEGLNSNVSTRGDLILLDADGAVVERDRISTNISSVSVRVVIQKTKEVPIQIIPAGTVEEGYGVAGEIEYQPTTVLIAGDEENLRTVREIRIEDIDITGLNATLETTVDINNYLPDGIVVADRTQEIAVKINIERLQEKTLTFRPDDIGLVGEIEGFEYEVTLEETRRNLAVTGLKQDLDTLKAADFLPTVDVSACTQEREYTLPIELEELEGLQYTNTLQATVTVKKADTTTTEADTGNSTEADSTEGN